MPSPMLDGLKECVLLLWTCISDREAVLLSCLILKVPCEPCSSNDATPSEILFNYHHLS